MRLCLTVKWSTGCGGCFWMTMVKCASLLVSPTAFPFPQLLRPSLLQRHYSMESAQLSYPDNHTGHRGTAYHISNFSSEACINFYLMAKKHFDVHCRYNTNYMYNQVQIHSQLLNVAYRIAYKLRARTVKRLSGSGNGAVLAMPIMTGVPYPLIIAMPPPIR